MNIKHNSTSSENKQINTKEYVIDTKIIMVVTGQQLRELRDITDTDKQYWYDYIVSV